MDEYADVDFYYQIKNQGGNWTRRMKTIIPYTQLKVIHKL